MFVSGSSSFYQANKSTFANYSHIHICSINLVFQTCSILNVDTCFIYIIGIINSLDKQLFLPYCIYVFHISYTIGIIIVSGIKLPYIFGIITNLGMDFLTTDNMETMMKMSKTHIYIFLEN